MPRDVPALPRVKFVLARRRPGLSREAFAAHWVGPHAALLAGLPAHRRFNAWYVQNLVLPDAPVPDQALDSDGIAEMALTGANGLFQAEPDYFAHVRPDEEGFLDIPETVVLYADAETPGPVPAGEGYKLLAFLERGPERDGSGDPPEGSRGFRRFRLDPAEASGIAAPGAPIRDTVRAVEELCFATRTGLDDFLVGPAFARLARSYDGRGGTWRLAACRSVTVYGEPG